MSLNIYLHTIKKAIGPVLIAILIILAIAYRNDEKIFYIIMLAIGSICGTYLYDMLSRKETFHKPK